jgi:hypothetical protein
VTPRPLFPAALTPDLLAGVVRPPRPAAGPAPAARLALLAPPALPPLVRGVTRPGDAPPLPGLATRAPGERSPGEADTASPPGADLLRGATELPPLEGGVVLASRRDARPAAKAAEVPLPLPEDLAEGPPPLPPLLARSPLLIDPPTGAKRPAPARPAVADALALAPALPPLPDEPPPAPTLRE